MTSSPIHSERGIALSELCQYIEEVIHAAFRDSYWIRAEISSLSTNAYSGHTYLDLVEKSPSGQIAANLRATCWGNIFPSLSKYFTESTGLKLQPGLQVLVKIQLSFHSRFGLAAQIIDIDPSFTMGDLARQRQETILRLQEEGVFDMQRTSLELPCLPRRLAVISSAGAAGYQDFCHQLSASGYAFVISFFPSTMQGDQAAISLVLALQEILKAHEKGGQFDAVVIIRGGGATLDLSCFDNYSLCAHCAQFPIPIISGIGHTRDVSILDMVAFMPLKTPTAVADFLIDRFRSQENLVATLRDRLIRTAERQVLVRSHRLEQLRQRFLFANERQILRETNHVNTLRQRLEASSPLLIYHRGYSLLTSNGQIVRSISDLPDGTILTTHLIDGTLTSSLISAKPSVDCSDQQ
ncbi:MAG: exodeoxyribonuclease VII large subunit [Paludibacteraceae bacterium]|nr:exodeoxyribonuclease VII large subunit [Paludibacteraceae bacterium]